MNEDVLNQILNEGNEKPAETQTATGNSSQSADSQLQDILNSDEGSTSNKGEEKPKTEKSYDPDMVWDDDSNEDIETDEPTDKAPDQQDDAELAAIEEKNKWMKGRLAPVKEKLTKAEQELAALRAENEALKAGKAPEKAPETQAQSQTPTSIDEFVNSQPSVIALAAKLKALDENADSMTQGEYIDQRLDILSDLKIEKREIVSAIKAQQAAQSQAIAQVEEKIASDYKSAVLSKKEEYPEIDKALSRVEKNAQNLDVTIRGMLVFEGEGINPLAAELVNIIGNDKDALGYLIAQSKLAAKTGRPPIQAIEYLGRLKARIQSERESAETMQAPDIDAQMTRRKPGLPKEVRNTSSEGESKDLQAWAREALKNGKRPW